MNLNKIPGGVETVVSAVTDKITIKKMEIDKGEATIIIITTILIM